MDNNNSLQKTLEKKAVQYLKKPFTLLEFHDCPVDPDCFVVKGTIPYYGQKVHVEVIVKKEYLNPIYWSITDQEIILNLVPVGEIYLGKNICVSDPCYDRDKWGLKKIHNVKEGTWNVSVFREEIDNFGERVYALELAYAQIDSQELSQLQWVKYGLLGVDSCQMSVFDDLYYRRKNGSENEFKQDQEFADAFYKACCSLSTNGNGIGIYYENGNAVGVVCESGCGCGLYPLQVKMLNGKIMAIQINFIP